MKKVVFLSLAEVVELHNDQIKRYGGAEGIRDINLLSSAVAMPYASFGGNLLHEDIFAMAAAYAFHICRDHPFIDENKRTALAAALVFLKLNRTDVSDPEGKLYNTMTSLASGAMGKTEFAETLRDLKAG